MRHRFIDLTFILVLAAPIGGCGSTETQPPKTPAPSANTGLTTDQQSAIAKSNHETGGKLNIDPSVLALCPDVKPPLFDYDSSHVKQRFDQALISLADCMKTGGMKGKSLLLVGHADPRGEPDYNLALGGQRADSVRNALVRLDVSGGRIKLSSRGEIDATGTAGETWKQDRRVDVKLASQ